MGAVDHVSEPLLLQAPVPVGVTRGPDHVFELANEPYQRLVGRRDLVGRSARELFSAGAGLGALAWLHEAYARGEVVADHEVPVRVRAADGAEDERFFDVVHQPLRGPDGAIEGVMTVAFEVTDKVRSRAAEARARLNMQWELRADVSTALSGAGSLDAILARCAEAIVRHLGVRAARLFTLPAGESGPPVLEAAAGEVEVFASRPAPGDEIAGVLRDRRPSFAGDFPADLRARDGAWARAQGMAAFAGFPLLAGDRLIGVLAIYGPSARIADALGVLALLADALAQGIERKRAEETLEQRAEELSRSNADLERFAYVASHDLQEPLRTVASFVQLLARRYQGKLDADADRYIGHVVTGVERMQRLIHDLLAYSRVGKDRKPAARVSLAKALAQALHDLAPLIRESGAVVTHDPLPVVTGDEGLLTQVLLNLIGNGVKFRGKDPPQIHISARRLPDAHEIVVRDNGIGIDPKYHQRIFVIFQRLHPASAYPGTGIGLAMCKKIIELHGGTLRVESAAGKGSSFAFTLPARGLSEER